MCRSWKAPKKAASARAELCESGEVAGKPLELTLLHGAPGAAAKRVLLAGAGKAEKFDAAEMRKLVSRGGAVPEAEGDEANRDRARRRVCAARDFAAAAVEGAILGDYEPDRYKGGEKKSLESVAIVGGDRRPR